MILENKLSVSSRTSYYLMFAPALIMLLVVLYPFFQGVYTSLTNQKLYLENSTFIGIGNYVEFFKNDEFRASIYRTLFYTLAVISIQIPLGITVAWLLTQSNKLQSLLRNTLVLPLLIPPVVAGLMWKTMMQPQSGILNWILNSIGLPSFNWLSDIDTALISVVLIDTWVFTPFAALIFLAGFQSIPNDMTEAAQIDGASSSLIFRAIQLPWLFPFIILVTLFRVSDSMKSFELFYVTTRGGPLNATRTLHITAYEEAFRWTNVGRAMAIVFFLWIISYFLSIFIMSKWKRKSEN